MQKDNVIISIIFLLRQIITVLLLREDGFIDTEYQYEWIMLAFEELRRNSDQDSSRINRRDDLAEKRWRILEIMTHNVRKSLYTAMYNAQTY